MVNGIARRTEDDDGEEEDEQKDGAAENGREHEPQQPTEATEKHPVKPAKRASICLKLAPICFTGMCEWGRNVRVSFPESSVLSQLNLQENQLNDLAQHSPPVNNKYASLA